jgi:hypothetical protein
VLTYFPTDKKSPARGRAKSGRTPWIGDAGTTHQGETKFRGIGSGCSEGRGARPLQRDEGMAPGRAKAMRRDSLTKRPGGCSNGCGAKAGAEGLGWWLSGARGAAGHFRASGRCCDRASSNVSIQSARGPAGRPSGGGGLVLGARHVGGLGEPRMHTDCNTARCFVSVSFVF